MNRKYKQKTRIEPRNKTLSPEEITSQHKYYADVQRDNYIRALKSSGIRARIYNPLHHGTICSCDLRDELLIPYMDPDIGERDIDPSENFYESSGRTKFAPKSLDLDSLDTDDDYEYHRLEEDDDPSTMLDSDLIDISGFNQSKCNICYGTGFVGGYSIPNGYRISLDAQYPNLSLTNLDIDKTTSPYSFKYQSNNSVKHLSFRNVFLPKTGSKIISRLWNNKEEIMYNDGINHPNSYANSSVFFQRISNSVTYNINDVSVFGEEYNIIISNQMTDFIFTHLELQFMDDKSYIDISQFPEEDEPSLMANLLSVSINCMPDSNIQKFSIINENKYNRAWQIKSVTPHKNHNDIIVSYECEARRVEPHEIYSNLLG